jgi:aliphatic sulfonates family ABC transporter substrate-binding protein
MKKRILSLLLIIISVISIAVFSGCSTGDDNVATNTAGTKGTEEKKVIHLAVQKAAPIPYLADALGYFEDEFADDNISVELVEFSLGPAIIEAVGGKQVDIGFLGDLPAFSGLINGGDYKIIARWESDTNRCLIVRDDAGINSLEDLRGKRLAVSFGSTQQTLAYNYLTAAGLTDSDVELVNLSLADTVTSIANGDIDAAVVDELQASQAIEKGGVTKLTDSEGYKLFVSPIIAQNDFLEENPEVAARILKVLQKAALWSEENTDESIKLTAEKMGVDESTVSSKLSHSNLELQLGDEEIEAIDTSFKQCYELGILKEKINIDDYIDTSYLELAEIQ